MTTCHDCLAVVLDGVVHLCPLHAAAPELRLALETLWKAYHTTNQAPGHPCYGQPRSTCDTLQCAEARAALKAAGQEGG